MTSGCAAVRCGCAQRDARQVEHGEDVGVELLVGQAEAEDVEVAERVARFQPVERDAVAAHDGFEVRPGAVDALGQQVGAAVDQVVEDHQAQVAAAQLVDVGEGERDSWRGWPGRPNL